MTSGKRIGILRKNLGYTQDDFANILNVHASSIKKYETDKMMPKAELFEKMVCALNVSPYVITQNFSDFELKTIGDLYSIIILLYNSKLLTFNKSITSNNIEIELNPLVAEFFDLKIKGENDIPISKKTLSVSINKTLKNNEKFDTFLKWIVKCNDLEAFINTLSDKNNSVAIRTITELKKEIEKIELDLQQSTEKL